MAVGRYIVFAALALHEHPEWARSLRQGTDRDVETFTHEVRRFYPFFPFVAGLVKTDFTWEGIAVTKGTRVMLDIYGTNHDEALWDDSEAFRPERFAGAEPSGFVPQGTGSHETGHRCPGEWVTTDLMKSAVRMLVDGMSYDVSEQDLGFSLSRVPALPRSGFGMSNVRASDGFLQLRNPHPPTLLR